MGGQAPPGNAHVCQQFHVGPESFLRWKRTTWFFAMAFPTLSMPGDARGADGEPLKDDEGRPHQDIPADYTRRFDGARSYSFAEWCKYLLESADGRCAAGLPSQPMPWTLGMRWLAPLRSHGSCMLVCSVAFWSSPMPVR
jgi:hypothetical protein